MKEEIKQLRLEIEKLKFAVESLKNYKQDRLNDGTQEICHYHNGFKCCQNPCIWC